MRVLLVTAAYAVFVFGLYATAGHTIAVVAGMAVFAFVIARTAAARAGEGVPDMKSLLAVALWAVFCGAAISNPFESLAVGLLGLIVIGEIRLRSKQRRC